MLRCTHQPQPAAASWREWVKGSAYKLVWQLGLFIYYFLCSCTVYTLHTGSRRRADRPVFSVILHLHKTQINTTMELNIRENNQNNNMVDNM